ncbi:hypothetical protein AT727_05990 [Desulfitobacterium hafniense]|uniref:Uncharacterized protein n=1 Tax=Desulfitobacterium hafniense TaxID=49338 RepID=A0A0W1JHG9_DESHA|nr:hypothetical protein AT727_05990 [Desulfitobacterium hafniense]
MKKAAGLEAVDKGICQQFFLFVVAAEIMLGRVESCLCSIMDHCYIMEHKDKNQPPACFGDKS